VENLTKNTFGVKLKDKKKVKSLSLHLPSLLNFEQVQSLSLKILI